MLLSLRTPPTSCSSQHAQCLCSLLLAAPTPELLSGFIGSGRLPTTLATAPAVVCVWGSPYSGTPPLLELPFSQCDLFPSLAILGLSWEETSVTLPGNRKGVMTSRCAGKHPAPPQGLPDLVSPRTSSAAERLVFCDDCWGTEGVKSASYVCVSMQPQLYWPSCGHVQAWTWATVERGNSREGL